MKHPSSRSLLARSFAIAAVAACAACGNLSQEDLLFLAAIPAKQALALTPPGADAPLDDGAPSTAQQALDPCEDSPKHLRCHARGIAIMLNTFTFALLDIVDAIVAHPPTTRRKGQRVWGPFFLQDQGNTARFEMNRLPDGESFRYCLHVKIGRALPGADDDVDCDAESTAGGFARILSGTFTAGVDAAQRARSGAGTMTLEARNLPDRGGPGLAPFDVVEFTYDNEGDGVAIVIDAVLADPELDPLQYTFAQTPDGAGVMTVELEANIDDSETAAPEHMQVFARWRADRAGRAEAVITDGDVPAGTAFQASECWGEDLERDFAALQWNGQREATGAEGLCVFTAADVLPAT